MQTTCGSDLDYDVLVIGGGPAGLSAALQLGRSLRSVLVCDNNEPRNGPAAEAHGYLTRDGIAPRELRRLGREEVTEYGGEFRDSQVTTVTRDGDGFISTLDNGETYTSRKLILASGVIDVFPDTDGQDVFDEKTRSKFVEQGIEIEEEPITALNGSENGLESVSLADGRDVSCHALFYGPPIKQHTELIEQLGLPVNETGLVEATRSQRGAGLTSIEGVFVAGDASSGSSLSVPSAAADGSEVGATVNMELSREAFEGGW